MTFIRPTKSEKREARKSDRLAKQKNPAPQNKTPIVADIVPRNYVQKQYLDAIHSAPQVFALGLAGTGKTYIATHWAVRGVVEGVYKKIIITRPMVSSDRNENIGFLPGDLNTKFTPWAVPLLDTIEMLIGKVKTQDWLRTGVIEFAPFQFMRGRTFGEDVIVILDEAQNCTFEQLKLFVTRLGDCKTIISGDAQQSDIRNSGLNKIVEMAERHNIDCAVIRFGKEHVVRSQICQEWVEAFEHETFLDRNPNYYIDSGGELDDIHAQEENLAFGD
jgi:phosphate starvation-inducible PhoH-like protein